MRPGVERAVGARFGLAAPGGGVGDGVDGEGRREFAGGRGGGAGADHGDGVVWVN